jgi:hypothetical protein
MIKKLEKRPRPGKGLWSHRYIRVDVVCSVEKEKLIILLLGFGHITFL